MEKTEMMERYEAETGKQSAIVKFMAGGQALEMKSYPKLGPYDYSTDYIAWLEAQLRWRPASEKPEKEGRYWVTCLWQEEDEIFYCSIEYALEKGWVADKNITVLYWLPIPPAPEGE